MRMPVLVAAVVIILVAALFFVGCDSASNGSNVNNFASQKNEQSLQNGVVPYGEGVYYFDKTGSDFGNALASFIIQYPDLELVAMTGNGTGLDGIDEGYFVVFRGKTKQIAQ